MAPDFHLNSCSSRRLQTLSRGHLLNFGGKFLKMYNQTPQEGLIGIASVGLKLMFLTN